MSSTKKLDDFKVEDKLKELDIKNEAAVILVWKLSMLSYSPFYPFYEINTKSGHQYVYY